MFYPSLITWSRQLNGKFRDKIIVAGDPGAPEITVHLIGLFI